jgi:hypothetical protein
MPKTKIAPRPPDDVPLWDALVAELGDPRPYEPTVTEFITVMVTDESCVDDAGFDDALSDLDDAVTDVARALDDDQERADELLDVLVDEFRERHSIPVPDDPTLSELRDQTVVLPLRLGERTVRMSVRGEPTWPS